MGFATSLRRASYYAYEWTLRHYRMPLESRDVRHCQAKKGICTLHGGLYNLADISGVECVAKYVPRVRRSKDRATVQK